MYRGDITPRASQTEWRRLSKTIRIRDNHQCRRCGTRQTATDRAFPIDHVIPWRVWRDKAQADEPRNLVTLCHRCHAIKTGDIERRWLKGDVLAFQAFVQAVGVELKDLAEMAR